LPESLHQNIPLIFGSPENVDMFITYCADRAQHVDG
jgi:fructose-1,6-bisphosphatase I